MTDHRRDEPVPSAGRSAWGPAVWERSGRLPSIGIRTPSPGRRPRPVREVVLAAIVRARTRLRLTLARVVAPVLRRHEDDAGDVPGWVLVTLMTAGLVLVLWGVARERLTEVFNDAIDGVVKGGR